MTRFAATLTHEVRLQARHRIYHVSAVLAPLLGGMLALLPSQYRSVEVIVPATMAFTFVITAFFFAGALILLEKSEGSLVARVVSPLRPAEDLAAKVLTLAGLAVAESAVVLAIGIGPAALSGRIVYAGIPLAILFALAGVMLVARYDNVNAYLMPAAGAIVVLLLPLLVVVGVAPPLWFAWHPVAPALWWLQGSASPLGSETWIFGLLGSAGWLAGAWTLSLRAHVRSAVVYARPGVIR